MNDRARAAKLTVGVTTRNRERSLLRCLASLDHLGDRVTEVIVIDDSSDVPVAGRLAGLPPAIAAKTRVVRQTRSEGPIVGRNTIMALARTDYVLLLDDDAYLIDGGGFEAALGVLADHPGVAAIGCAQAEADGRPWPASMQPAPVSYRCRIAAYIGFAHILRRQAFQAAGGYREELHFYGEEKVLCAQLLTHGYQIVYMPDLLVAHVPDPAGRSRARYLRYVIRNDCLFALYSLPFLAMCATLPLRLARYFSMNRQQPLSDPAGFFWIAGQVLRAIPGALRTRRPMTWGDLAEWRRLRRAPPPWGPPHRAADADRAARPGSAAEGAAASV
jgi:glycosyltransferase involved in cell wall biosynthesis